jgi:hypothetical protein
VGILSPDREEAVATVKVGIGPNGLAYSAEHRLLLAGSAAPGRPGYVRSAHRLLIVRR